MTKRVLFLFVPVLLGWVLPARSEPPEPLEVEARPLDGERVRGPLTQLDASSVTVGERTWTLGELRSIRAAAPPKPRGGDGPHLRAHLVAGETLVGTFERSVEDGLVLRSPSLGPIEVAFDLLRTLVTVPADAGDCYEPERKHPAVDGEDVIYVRGGDAFQGLLVAATPDGLELENEDARRGGVTRVAWNDFRVLHLANETPERPAGVVTELGVADGSRLLATPGPTLEGTVLRVPLLSGPAVVVPVPLDQVVDLQLAGGRFVRATTLPFSSRFRTPYEAADAENPGAPFLEAWFGARVDRRPSGCPLRLAGRTYAHGFAVHAHSTLTLPLGKRFARFETLFGVDDEALEVDAGGVVDARVLADGEVVWEAKGVKAGHAPRRVGPIDVKDVETLVLEVDFGPELHVRDRATWADPILVRAP